MAYIEDIGNGDVRSEGMSYGMMIAVQFDKKEVFDRLWKWAKTYMYQSEEPYQGYFAWHCTIDGEKLDANPASDGEEWFAMALLFASARWRDGTDIFDYKSQAQEILDVMLHKEDTGSELATNMFNLEHNGMPLSSDHSMGLVSMAAVAALAADPEKGKPFVQELWDAQIPSGKWRYYDGMLYMLGLLHASGNFRIHTPQ